MNILYHHRTQGHGAEGVHILGIVRGLEARGHRVLLCSPPGVDPRQTAGSYVYGAKKSALGRVWKSISRHCPQIIFESIEVFYNFYHGRRLASLLGKGAFDFAYERYAFFLWATALACSRRKIPLILEVNEITGIKRARPLVLQRLARRIEKFVFMRAARVVTVSSFLKRKIVEMGVPENRVVVMPNGVDHEIFSPRAQNGDVSRRYGLTDSIVIGFVGWIDPWDNLPGLLDVLAELVKRREKLKLLLIGDVAGKGVEKNLVADLVSKRGLTAHVVHLPRVPRAEMPAHIGAMDVCVIPDSNPFGSPIVLFEFMGVGKAVVAPSVDPVVDVVRHEENGLVFKAHDGASLRDNLWRAVEDPELRRKMAANARLAVERRHNWGKNAEAVLGLFHEIQAKARAAS